MAENRLIVVAEASKFADDMSHGVVVVECVEPREFNLAIEELSAVAARQLALGYAASRGVADPRINGSPGFPYPVNKDGQSLEQVKDGETGEPLPAKHPKMQPARYRIDIPVTRRLV